LRIWSAVRLDEMLAVADTVAAASGVSAVFNGHVLTPLSVHAPLLSTAISALIRDCGMPSGAKVRNVASHSVVPDRLVRAA
jgi:hypothetical protein